MAKCTEAGKEIAKLIGKADWQGARALLLRELRRHPHHHWLLDRLSETYYGEGRIALALRTIKKAYKLNPECPLVLWDYANTLEEVGEIDHARQLYEHILARGTEKSAHGECGEGSDWAMSLLSDSAYRLALCYERLNRHTDAKTAILTNVHMRDQGAKSIYPKEELQQAYFRIVPPVTSASNTFITSGLVELIQR